MRKSSSLFNLRLGAGLLACVGCAPAAEGPSGEEVPGRRAAISCPGTTPPGGLMLTFDDAYVDSWYDQLRPVLDSYGAKATFFVTRYYRLNSALRSKLSALAAAGHQIDSHTMDHADAFSYTPSDYLREQVLPDLASLTAGGHLPRSFAYPFGNDTPQTDTELLRFFDYVRDTQNSQGGSPLVRNLDRAFRRCDGNRRVAGVGIDTTYSHSDQEFLDGLDRAKCQGENLIVYGHHSGTPPAGGSDFYHDLARVRLLLSEAAARGLRVRRLRDLCSWQASARGAAAPARVADSPLRRGDVRFADFDGDGDSDAFQATGALMGKWRILRNQGGTFVTGGGDEHWTDLNSSTAPLGRLAFGDFNGDRKSDVLYGDGSRWFLSASGSGPLVQINSQPEFMDQLAVGDFNGDGKADLLRADGVRWHVSYSATSPWTQLNTSSTLLQELALGDFNGDGRTDVLRVAGGQFRVSLGGSSPWTVLRSGVTETVQALRFADFDGDGRTDALRATGSEWSLSSGAAQPWRKLRDSAVPLGELSVLDLNGDGVSDLLYTAAPND